MRILQKPVAVLLLLLILAASCNGQEEVKQAQANKPERALTGRPKMIKTQKLGQYANVHDGVQDKAGNLWFCTTGEGVYRFDGETFTNFTVKDGLSSNVVYTVMEDKTGDIWFGTETGICRYDGKTFSTVRINTTRANDFTAYSPGNNTAAGNMVSGMLQDKSGKIWVGTTEGIYCYDGKSFAGFYNDPVIKRSGFRLNVIQNMIQDKSGSIWFASWEREGACRYDGASITGFTPNGDDMVYSILEDRSGNIWFGTRNHGACLYDPATGRFTAFDTVATFNTSSVYAIAEDKAGNIWFGTEAAADKRAAAGGVWRYSPPAATGGTASFANFTTKDGLTDNAVFSITIDKAGKLWFGTRGIGLCSYDGKTFVAYSGQEEH